ncbi:lipopolysaccharide biosynthesis protein [Faecalicatena fissicatena]|uniref:Lipopolysaccharide biosynthesis protein n=2 Tax=Faecalicatena fissicatena TaxID=290055 RepID=A0ABS2E8L1_9FIRM|nr:lipopolysaccharide biosynthesis protein [Faecalicatena fissicatena]
MIHKLIYSYVNRGQVSEKKNFLWNMIGSGVYAASSMLLSLVVIKMVGASQGGIFSIAITLSQMLVYIAYFETRTFQVTDSTNKFTFSEYHTTKIFLCLIMILTSAVYVFVIQQYYLEKAIIVFLVCLLRFQDGYADVYEAQLQKQGRLDLAGKSLAYRTILFSVSLCVSLLLTDDLILSLIVSNIFGLAGVWIFDIEVMGVVGKISITRDMEKVKQIIVSCVPLFVGVFCWTYILSASRIAIDGNMASEFQSYYQVIFMPVSVINLFAQFLFRPLLPRFAEDYNSKKYADFYGLLRKGIAGIFVLTVICMAGAYVLGIPVLSVLSGCKLDDYRGELVFLVFAGGFNAVSFTFYYILTVMRETKGILVNYLIAAFAAFVISSPMVRTFGIPGAAWSYFVVVLLLCFLFMGTIYRRYRKDIRTLN